MHEFFQKYGVYIIVGCVVIAGMVAWIQLRPRSMPPTGYEGDPALAFFVDEANGDESVGSGAEIPPLMGKGGKPTVVIASKYTCDGGKTSKVLCFSKYTDEMQAKINSISPGDLGRSNERAGLLGKGRLVRSPEPGSKWVDADSAEAQKLMTYPVCPDGNVASMVYPQKQ